jgi:hypothetical protein
MVGKSNRGDRKGAIPLRFWRIDGAQRRRRPTLMHTVTAPGPKRLFAPKRDFSRRRPRSPTHKPHPDT